MSAPADSSVLSTDHTFFIFSFIFNFIIDNYNYEFVQKGYRNEVFLLFAIFYPKINMEVVKTIFRLDNNLPTQIIENKGFPRQKSRQLPSAEANLEGCQKHQSALKLPYHSTKAVH